MAGRKRKADEDMAGDGDTEDRMSASPSNSPAPISRQLPHGQQRQIKRPKSSVTGRPLTLPRLLETLDAESMRTVLQSLCERHPELGGEVTSMAPRPSVASALSVLNQYESALRTAFPFGGNTGSDYAYNRVRQPLMDLLDALNDFTPHFLPPNETQTAVSLNFLDEGTNFIHRLPGWQTKHHNLHKENAYEEISKAWALVIKEASKRGGGIILQYGGWDQKIIKHDEQSGGKMHSVVSELSSSLGWFSPGQTSGSQQGNGGASHSNDTSSIRQQLLSGTYGSNLPVRVGPW